MIKDRLENAGIYYGISENLKTGFEWLKNNDLSTLPDGKYEIRENEIYANLQSYDTKETAPYEAHKKYIDIQFMITGKEKIGVTAYSNCSLREEYNEEKDIEFLSCNITETYQILESGEFLVLFPQDAHQPSLSPDKKSNVKKVVVKVKI